MTDKEALKLALEALEEVAARTGARWALEQGYAGHLEALTAIKQAIAAQPALVHEPVAWITQAGVLTKTDTKAQGELYGWTPLYTAPEPAQEPNNFCPRCGKRLEGVLGRPQMHTCTPPLWGHT